MTTITAQDKPDWYTEDITSIPPEAQDLLENYSHIPSDKIVPHVLALRDKAFQIWTYACIGQLRFLSPNLGAVPTRHLTHILDLIRNGATFLDSGCCFGQEIRYLVHTHKIPSSQLYGFDLESRFTEFGFELFRDQSTLKATFLSGDVTAAPESPEAGALDSLVGKMDVVFASSFLHVWDWDEMLHAAKRLASFLVPRKGSLFVGRQLGSLHAKSYPMPTKGGSNFRHNVESMRVFWEQVGRETESKWKVEGGLYEGEETRGNKSVSWSEPDMRMLWFVATREG